jgi:predicted GIY-YIG superfamily endonuclease
VDHFRYRIFYKNGRIKTGALRSFYSKIYQYFVEEGHLSDVTIKKPMTASFQTNGGVYAWEANGKVIYIGRTNNFHNRIKQHRDCFVKGCREKKYTSGYSVHDIKIILLAITNDNDSQKVLETVFFHKHRPSLNMIGTLRMDRILNQKNYNAIFQETLRSENEIKEDEDQAFEEERQTLIKDFETHLESYKKTLIYY